MYTSYIGKKFLKQYNKRTGANLSAQEFFNTVLFPLFFDDDRHLMHVHGSTFFQKVGKDFNSAIGTEHQYRLKRLHDDLEKGVFSGSTYVGYAAGAIEQTSTGQITSLQRRITEEEAYLSWVGQALAIGVYGRFCVLIDDENVLWTIYCGWEKYRQNMDQSPGLKPREIEFWNCQWLCHHLINNKKDNFFLDTEVEYGNQRIVKIQWCKVVFALSKRYPKSILTVNCYKFDKQNETLGFINFFLPEICSLFQLRDVIFLDHEKTVLHDNEIINLEPYFNFKNACARGTIGLTSLEPKGLRELMPKGSRNWAAGKDFKFKDEQSQITFQLYKLWIMAVLNKKELLKLADETAESLIAFERTSSRGKKTEATLSQEVRDSKNVREFIAKLTGVLELSPANGELFKKVVDEVILLPVDTFPMFVTLVRFQYAYRKNSTNN